jgi:hypothetical protein
MDLLTPYSHNFGLQAMQRYRWSTHFRVQRCTHTRVFILHQSLSLQRIYNSLTVSSNQTWSLLFTAHFLSSHYSATANSEGSIQFLCSQAHVLACSRFDTRFYSLFLLPASELFFITSLHELCRNHCLHIIGKACLERRCIAIEVIRFLIAYPYLKMNVYSDFAIPAFGHHVKI